MQDQITLDKVKQAFEQWRAGKRHQRESAPEDLRALLMAILPYYSRREITKALTINPCQLDRYIQQNQPTESGVMSSNEFIEFPISKLAKKEPGSVAAKPLTITRSDGSSWILSDATQDMILQSLRLFLRD